jgi:hypothetical protein
LRSVLARAFCETTESWLHSKKKQEQEKGIQTNTGVHTSSFLGENTLPEVGNFLRATSIDITPEIEAVFNIKGIAIDTHHQRPPL